MNKNPSNTLITLGLILFVAFGCGLFGETKTRETKSGRLKYVEEMRFGRAGVHGGKSWYVENSYLQVNDGGYKPEGINVKEDIGSCEASPNESVEALKCYSFANSKETVYLLRMKDDKPLWETISSDDSIKSRGKNFGEWLNEGKTLIFKDYFFNVQTGEKTEIKGLPDYPENDFRGTSPDLEMIIYEGFCFNGYVNVSVEVEFARNRTCNKSQEYIDKKQLLLWVIDSKTGATTFVPLNREKYDWLFWNREKFSSKADWLTFFRQQLIWEKDKDGKYQLVSPK